MMARLRSVSASFSTTFCRSDEMRSLVFSASLYIHSRHCHTHVPKTVSEFDTNGQDDYVQEIVLTDKHVTTLSEPGIKTSSHQKMSNQKTKRVSEITNKHPRSTDKKLT